MPDKGGKLSQTTLILRLLCGGYLVYLGGSLLLSGETRVPLLCGAAAFLLAGAALLGLTGRRMYRDWKNPDETGSEAE